MTRARVKRQVAILAGGLGTRLRPITEKIPKPLAPVADRPFLYWQLLDLKSQGFLNVVLLVAYLGEKIEEEFGDGRSLGMNLKYVYEPEPLGTGGALKNALPALESEFFLLNGDSFLRAPMEEMGLWLASGRYDAVVSVYDNHDPVPVIPNLKVRDGRVLDYQKDAGLALGFDRIDSGVYVMKRSVIESVAQDKFALADLWPPLIAKGRLGAFDVPIRFFDIGTPERLAEFEREVRGWPSKQGAQQ